MEYGRRGWLIAGAVLAALVGAVGAAAGGPRDATLAELRALEVLGETDLHTWVNAGDHYQVSLGTPVRVKFRCEREAYLTAIHVDPAGDIKVLVPGDQQRVAAGRIRLFPDDAADFSLVASEPVGEEAIYAFATEAPLRLADLRDTKVDHVLSIDAADGPDFARRLRAHLESRPQGSVSVARYDQEIVAQRDTRGRGLQRAPQIVATLIQRERTRSIRRPRVALDVKFDTASDALAPEAIEQLDELGKALQHTGLATRHFALEGHTDDRGEPDYNLDLSQRRANRVLTYLVERYEIAPERLDAVGRGESEPMVDGSGDYARALNRRVVLELKR